MYLGHSNGRKTQAVNYSSCNSVHFKEIFSLKYHLHMATTKIQRKGVSEVQKVKDVVMSLLN
jgi:hypothetical protein